ncbi:MAG: DAK2 domain-containing protein [Rhodobacteraceae bacterium]|nr:DAK2 domain-containing protein [Paracoccaceae bacterium]
MTHFINEPENSVTEAIDGLIAASGGKLARLDGYPHIRVVIRSDWDKSRVALISGGGSGHEPAHAGFVGAGMLTAAVCGDVFASPSVEAVLAAILAVAGPDGCLLIVKNYTGDRLNFGLAAARARSLGRKVEMVIVGDDIALPYLSQPRGVAGTLFVHKITGALAREGADLATIAKAARRVAEGTKSFGMSLDTCVVPGSPKEDRIPSGMIELGLGIHGEPGVKQADFKNARTALAAVCVRLTEAMNDRPHVALVNNLGGTSNLEMSVIVHELIQSHLGDKITHIVGPATMMGSLGMHGVSISTYPAKPRELELLVEPVSPYAWPGVFSIAPVATVPLPSGLEPMNFSASANPLLSDMLAACCKSLIAARMELNALDAKSGDGDTGSTVAKAAETLLVASERLPFAEPSKLCQALAQILGQAMGGSSGILLSIYFAATGNALARGCPTIEALKLGLAEIVKIGGAKPGARTMIDALEPALDSLVIGIKDAALAARKGANHTSTILKAGAGRASYVGPDQLSGHIDPGAEAVARVFECLAKNAHKKLL